MKSTLRGLFDADGSFNCKRCYGKYDNEFRKKYHCQPRIEIRLTSEKLIKQIFVIIQRLDLFPSSIKIRPEGFFCGKNCRESYLIRLNRLKDIKQWFENLQLSNNPKHLTKYFMWKKYGFCPPYTTVKDRKAILNGEIDPYLYYH